MDSDRPIETAAEDRLGFGPVAQHLAQVILDQSAKDGLVFGVEGEWGSGKSTLINLAISALREGKPAPEIIAYSPWLVGSRDDLLGHLFDELSDAASRIDPIQPVDMPPPQTWRDWITKHLRGDAYYRLKRKERLKKQLGGKLKAFGAVAGGLARLIRSSAVLGVPHTETAGTIVDRAGDGARSIFSSASITQRKSEIVEALKLLSRRIVVFVDDLDRLEPREASEVLRLIRAVADFPNVIYILSYDVEVVSNTLRKAVQVDDGHAFLEKIVQVSFKVPRPEAFDLRRWFHDEVRRLFAEEIAQATQSNERLLVQRLARAIDVQGGRYLTTPRDVVRALNSLRLHAIPVRANVDVADMVWLQLVRIGNPAFYSWIEGYLTETSAIYRGAGVTGDVAAFTGQRLNDILAAENLEVDYARADLSTILPGVERGFGGQDVEQHRVFNNLGREAFNQFVANRRLGSPEHYRYYFAFALPGGALRDDQVDTFLLQARHSRNSTISILQELAREARPQGGVMAEIMIERLIAAIERIPQASAPNILSALADILDDVALSTRDEDWGLHRSWEASEKLVQRLMHKVRDPAIRQDCIVRLFAEGRAVGWQTHLLRSEIFAHGHFGEREKPESLRLLNSAEFQQALTSMLSRYDTMPVERLMAAPNLLSLLYGWKQAARSDDAKRWVEANTQGDDELLAFLSRARGPSFSNEVFQHPLRRQDLSNFLDYGSAVRRVEAIAGDTHAPEVRRQLAAELLTAFRQGERD